MREETGNPLPAGRMGLHDGHSIIVYNDCQEGLVGLGGIGGGIVVSLCLKTLV